MIVVAHRGARAFAPENTLAAIDMAARQRADAVEIDVQLSRDGRVVVVHDDDLVRCSDARARFPDRAPWRVTDFTFDELRTLDAGGWHVAELAKPAAQRQAFLRVLEDGERETWVDAATRDAWRSGEVRIPTLDECLDACAAFGLELNVEIKVAKHVPSGAPDLIRQVVAALSPYRARVVVSSFDHAALAGVRALDPDVRIGVLSDARLADPAAYVQRLGAQRYHPGAKAIGLDGVVDDDAIAAMRSAGGTWVWTVNDRPTMRKAIDAGIAGLFTDYPARLRALLDGGPR